MPEAGPADRLGSCRHAQRQDENRGSRVPPDAAITAPSSEWLVRSALPDPMLAEPASQGGGRSAASCTEGIYEECETELGKGWWRR